MTKQAGDDNRNRNIAKGYRGRPGDRAKTDGRGRARLKSDGVAHARGWSRERGVDTRRGDAGG